ncbi:hypothetical protein ACG04Q_23460 [Roseateles sp. DXS20W]|uniref:DUF4064 domain-containing protein n=1 Tax=Pelomonas lactea TaxID=3299030 RepID=A0ABW7GRF9_9BURK
MKTLFKILFIGSALMVLLAMIGGFALLNHHGPDMHIVLDDGEFFLGNGLGDWLGASLGLFIAGIVCLFVVPLVLLLGVALPLLIVGGVVAVILAALLGAGAVLGSPLILLGLLLFVVLRNRSRANAAAAATRIEPV